MFDNVWNGECNAKLLGREATESVSKQSTTISVTIWVLLGPSHQRVIISDNRLLIHDWLQDLDEQHDRARVLVPGQSGVPQRSLDPECLHLQPQEFPEHRRPQETSRSVL